MFRNYYHYFIAGLPDLFLDENDPKISLEQFKSEAKESLTPDDLDLVKLLFLKYDNENLLNFIDEKYDNIDSLGNFSLSDFEKEFSEDRKGILPPYMYDFVDKMSEEEADIDHASREDILTGMYYKYAISKSNNFISKWFTFNLNIQNILTGLNCRKFNLDPDNYLIGDNFITEAIKKSSAKDFGLEVEYPYVTDLMALFEKENLLMIEKGLDQLRWDKAEEMVLFSYFTIEVILTYVLKLQIVQRWTKLDEETGKKLFSKLIYDLKNSFEFPKEFSLNGKKR